MSYNSLDSMNKMIAKMSIKSTANDKNYKKKDKIHKAATKKINSNEKVNLKKNSPSMQVVKLTKDSNHVHQKAFIKEKK